MRHRLCVLLFGLLAVALQAQEPRPNVLWLVAEDIGPHLGCYGDPNANTPAIDALAQRGVTYKYCWSSAPVCAPARTAIITGISPTSLGAEHMRSLVPLPASIRLFPQLLREAGYYCTNNAKEDYNVVPNGKVWDESSGRAHWRNRKAGQPFFAVFNINLTHESQIRKRPYTPRHAPSLMRIPARQPDDPDVRLDWAQYYDRITQADEIVRQRLEEVQQAGLTDSTIVFFYGDNGPGMPGFKRSARDSGLRVPLVIYVPPKFKHLAPAEAHPGGVNMRMQTFVDLAPTVLSLAGITPPDSMQGEIFLGSHRSDGREYHDGFRGRMDERIDLVRSIRNQQYVFVRNYLPHLPEGQHVAYMFETPSTRAWKRAFDEGRLSPAQRSFWEPRSPRELYEIGQDPDEIHNLAETERYAPVADKLEQIVRERILKRRDIGFLPEAELHARCKGSTPYEVAHDPQRYPLERILPIAELAAQRDPKHLPRLVDALRNDTDAAVRYWGAMGVLIRGPGAIRDQRDALSRSLDDASSCVRIVAAEALLIAEDGASRERATAVLLDAADCRKHDAYTAIQALNAIDLLKSMRVFDRSVLAKLPSRDDATTDRIRGMIPRLLTSVLAGDEMATQPASQGE